MNCIRNHTQDQQRHPSDDWTLTPEEREWWRTRAEAVIPASDPRWQPPYPVSADALARRHAAVAYAGLGFAVVPAGRPVRLDDDALGCSCWLGRDCDTIGKHPLRKHKRTFLRRAYPPELLVTYWMTLGHGDHNVILLPGQRSGGIFAFDVDSRSGGSLDTLREMGIPVDDTCLQESGSGGWHVFFRWPFADEDVPNIMVFADAIEMKGAGALLVLAPSLHKSGGRYRWPAGRSPWEQAILTLPEHIAITIRDHHPHYHPRSASAAADVPALDDEALERLGQYVPYFVQRAVERVENDIDGGRHNSGFWLACQLRDLRVSYDVGRAAMLEYQRRIQEREAQHGD